MEPIQFLRAHPPFDRLAAGMLRELESGLEIAYHPKDTRILLRGGPPNRHLFVIRKGTVRLEREGELVQVLEEGECFGYPSLIGKTSPHVDVVAAEDTLIYQVPGDVFDRLMTAPEFAQFFLVDLSERLRQTSSSRPLPLGRELGTPVGRLPVATPVSVACETTVGEAARLMREKRISSVLVECDPPGILTDRDLRSRVLAEGRGPDTQVGEVATRPMLTISADATLFETLVFMLEHHVHHAPLVRDGHVIGIVTDTDLLRLYMKTPIYLLRNIERVALPDDMARYDTELAAMVETMVWGGLDGGAGRARGVAAERRAGGALPAHRRRGARAAAGAVRVDRVRVGGAHGADAPHRPGQRDRVRGRRGRPRGVLQGAGRADRARAGGGGVPAVPGRLHGDQLAAAARVVGGAVPRAGSRSPEPRALIEALNFFDFRVGARRARPGGARRPAAQGRARADLHGAPGARVGRAAAAARRVPAHPRDRGRRRPRRRAASRPSSSLARLYALEAGCASRSTLERLEGAAHAGTLSREGADTLAEGFRFLLGLRLREQLRALRAGGAVSNHVRLEHLEPVERQHLKDIFVAIREIQQAAELRYAVQRLA